MNTPLGAGDALLTRYTVSAPPSDGASTPGPLFFFFFFFFFFFLLLLSAPVPFSQDLESLAASHRKCERWCDGAAVAAAVAISTGNVGEKLQTGCDTWEVLCWSLFRRMAAGSLSHFCISGSFEEPDGCWKLWTEAASRQRADTKSYWRADTGRRWHVAPTRSECLIEVHLFKKKRNVDSL